MPPPSGIICPFRLLRCCPVSTIYMESHGTKEISRKQQYKGRISKASQYTGPPENTRANFFLGQKRVD